MSLYSEPSARTKPSIAIQFFLLLATLFLSGTVNALAQNPTLRFAVAGQMISEISLTELTDTVTPVEIDFYNPLMSKKKRYLALPVTDVLDFVFKNQWRSGDYSDIAFTALDGYQAVSNLDSLKEPGGYLAFQDLDWETGWEPVGRKLADPGPFFLVWTEKHQTTANAFPWPWQVAKIGILKFSDQYPAVVPLGVTTDSPVHRGFQTFRMRCLRCHAMDQQGGKIGPDLNAPQSIVSYRTEEMIKAFIKQPSQFRYSRMPDHSDLSDQQLDELYQYLKHQKR